MERKKKIITASLLGIVLVAILVFCFPFVKLRLISDHDEWYGSYLVFPGEKSTGEAKAVQLVTKSAEYRQKGIKIHKIDRSCRSERGGYVVGFRQGKVFYKISAKTQFQPRRTAPATGNVHHSGCG